MTLYRATVLDTPRNPFEFDDALAVEGDGALVVRDGVIVDRGPFADIAARHPDDEVMRLEGGVLVPGFVDTHVHYPQIRAIGGLGMPLLDWLDKCAFPEECRFVDAGYAAARAVEFFDGLVSSGTTSALVFGSHFAPAMDAMFDQAQQRGLNITSGLVLSDRLIAADLLTDPDRAAADSAGLIDRWHGRGRLKYAVTPRFSLSASDAILEVCRATMTSDLWFTSHINENRAEIETVAALFPGRGSYLDTYLRHDLIGPRSVLAHNVHPTDAELKVMGELDAVVAHCPTSNAALGSGLFPLRRHLDHGVRVALGSDVGAGTGLFLPKEALQAYFIQQLLGAKGQPLTPGQLLWLSTAAGADALGISDRVGDLAIGKEFDAVWLRPAEGSQLDVNLRNAVDATDALARIFALATPADVAGVWARGELIHRGR